MMMLSSHRSGDAVVSPHGSFDESDDDVPPVSSRSDDDDDVGDDEARLMAGEAPVALAADSSECRRRI